MTSTKLEKSKRSENIFFFLFCFPSGSEWSPSLPLVFLSLQLLPSRRREEKERQKKSVWSEKVRQIVDRGGVFVFLQFYFGALLLRNFREIVREKQGDCSNIFFSGSNTGAGSIWKSMCKKTHLLAYWTEPRHAMLKIYMKANVAHFGLNSKYNQGNPLPPPPSVTGLL